MVRNVIVDGGSVPPVISIESQEGEDRESVQLSGAEPALLISSEPVEFAMVLLWLNVKLLVETLIMAWLLIVIATVTCWLCTGVPLSVSEIVIRALITPAVAWAM